MKKKTLSNEELDEEILRRNNEIDELKEELRELVRERDSRAASSVWDEKIAAMSDTEREAILAALNKTQKLGADSIESAEEVNKNE